MEIDQTGQRPGVSEDIVVGSAIHGDVVRDPEIQKDIIVRATIHRDTCQQATYEIGERICPNVANEIDRTRDRTEVLEHIVVRTASHINTASNCTWTVNKRVGTDIPLEVDRPSDDTEILEHIVVGATIHIDGTIHQSIVHKDIVVGITANMDETWSCCCTCSGPVAIDE